VPSGTWLLLFWTLTGAAWLFVHVMAIVRVARAKELEPRWKWAALVPPITAWSAWKAGRRVTAVVWASLAVLYVVLRLMD
jgi:hypothetical protein